MSDATVALNARAAIRQQLGGVERYAQEVIGRLLALRPDRYRVIAPRARLAHRSGHVWEQLGLPWQARDCRLLYSPANLAPLAGPPGVVVIHDVAALARPDSYSSGYVAYQRVMLPAIARRAARIVTVSEFSRAEIVERLGVAPERITVIPGGVSDRFGPSADVEDAREEYRLPSEYVLAVGTASARKNHGMLEALAGALRERGTAVVLAGSNRGYLRGEVPSAGIRRLGYVTDGRLAGLYAGARAFVMPSLHEGFGLPCLEAMASATPVVAAAAGALPEACGDAALLVDPGDHRGFAEAVRAVIDDEPLRSRLIADGRRRAAQFTWQRTAERTDAEVTKLVGSVVTGRRTARARRRSQVAWPR